MPDVQLFQGEPNPYDVRLRTGGISYLKAFSDSVTLTDDITKLPQIVESDTITLSEDNSKLYSAIESDTVNLLDGIIKDVFIIKSDSIFITDDIVKNIFVNEADIIILSDLITIIPPVPPIPVPTQGIGVGGGGSYPYRAVRRKRKYVNTIGMTPYGTNYIIQKEIDEHINNNESGRDIDNQDVNNQPDIIDSVEIKGWDMVVSGIDMVESLNWKNVLLGVKVYKLVKHYLNVKKGL